MRRSRFPATARAIAGASALGIGLAFASGAMAATIIGSPGDNTLTGTRTSDRIIGLDGNDLLRGLEGNDLLRGNGGDDDLRGGPGQDTLLGDAGDDELRGGPNLDSFDGGDGDDRIDAVDGVAEPVRCGSGADDARVDPEDMVDESCETSTTVAGSRMGVDLFWSSLFPRRIASADISGQPVNRDVVRAGPFSLFAGVATDTRFVYWADFVRGRIMRARHDGTRVRTLVGGLQLGAIWDVAVDDEYIYWTNSKRSRIGRAKLNGRQVDRSFISVSPLGSLSGLAVDENFIYWNDLTGRRIGRARIDGTGVDVAFIRLLIRGALSYDVAVGQEGIYWTDYLGQRIGRADLDGSNVNPSFIPSIANRTKLPTGIAVDGTHVYWGDFYGGFFQRGGNSISRANLNGSGVERDWIPRANYPWSVGVERAPLLSARPGRINFGDRPVDTGPSASRTTTVRNVGNWPLQVFSVGVSGVDADQFGVTRDTCSGTTLAPDATCEVDSSFDPTTPGGKQANLRIQSDSVKRPNRRVRLRGVGTQAEVAITPTSRNYGDRPVSSGPSAAEEFTVSNQGTAPLVVGTVSIGGEDASQFEIPSGEDGCTGMTLAPGGGSCDVGVAFDPKVAGELEASLRVPTNDPSAPLATAGLEGRGITAAAAIAPRSVDFGTVDVKKTAPAKTFTVTSVGDAPLKITRVQLVGSDAGQFSITATDCNGARLDRGKTCEASVDFTPTAGGAFRTDLEVIADDPGVGNPAAAAAIAGTGNQPGPPQPPPIPPPFPPPNPPLPPSACGTPEITGTAATGGTTRVIGGVRQRFVTHSYNTEWAASGRTRCAEGMVINLYGPLLNRRSAVRLADAGQPPVQLIAQARINQNGGFRLPTQARPAGQYFIALADVDPLAGTPVFLRVRPTGKAVPKGRTRVRVFAGPPQATAGTPVVLQRRLGGKWRNFSRGAISARARADLPAPPSGVVRAVVLPPGEPLITRTVYSVDR